MKTFDTYLTESSLSRVYSHNKDHDCGALSAFRRQYSKDENVKRNRMLKAKLTTKGYGVTAVKGKYPEGGNVKTEESFWVVDLQDTGNLEKDLAALGKEFEQDSVLIVPKGAVEQKARGYLLGTSNSPDAEPGMGKKMLFDKAHFAKTNPYYTTLVNGRPFIFESCDCREVENASSGMGEWARNLMAKKDPKQK